MLRFNILAFSSLIFSYSVLADVSSNSLTGSQQELVAGNIFRLGLTSEIGSIDNFLFQNKLEQSTSYVFVAPTLLLQSQFERNLFQLNTKTSHYKYDSFSNDDHSDFMISGKYQHKFSPIQTIFANAFTRNSYEYRGTGLTLGIPNSVNEGNERKNTTTEFGYIHGDFDSILKLKATLGINKSSYKRIREITRQLDAKHQYLETEFDYMLSSQTYLSSVISLVDVNFDYNEIMNRKEYAVLGGAKWKPSEITNVELLLGYQNVKLDQTGQRESTFSWRANIRWMPLIYTEFNINSSRSIADTNKLQNSYRVIDSHRLTAKYDFSNRLQGLAQIGIKLEEIVYQNESLNEDYYFIDFSMKYQWQSWLSFHIKYNFEQLKADEELLNHDRNGVSLGFNVNI